VSHGTCNAIRTCTEVGESRFAVVRMEKDVQAVIITVAKIDKS
jgi:hypothetical protein